MGEAALRSHNKGEKHVKNMEKLKTCTQIDSFFKKTASSTEKRQAEPTCTTSSERASRPGGAGSVTSFVTRNDTLRAEVI